MTSANALNKLLQVIYRYTAPLLLILFFIGGVSVIWYMDRQQTELVKTLTLNNAELYTEAITEFRTLYTSEVVETVREQGIQVTHDYQEHHGAIPLPATLSILLGQRIGQGSTGADIKLYSPYPFPWRQEEGGLNTSFAKDAWSHFQQYPEHDFYSFESLDTGEVLRYAIADKMRPDCVKCHNNHPDTPKADWQVGDVRGVLEVVLPIKKVVQQADVSLEGLFWLVSGISVMGLLTLFLLIGRLNFNYMRSQHALKEEIEQGKLAQIELMEINEDLKNSLDTVQSLQASMIESETMAALGGMVAGIAHEINTPLGISITANSFLDDNIRKLTDCYQQGNLTRSQFESYQQESLCSTEIMSKNLSRAADLIQSFKQVAVDQTSQERRTFNLHNYLNDVILALQPEFKSTRHKIEIHCPEELKLDSYPGAISQIITNLIVNSLKHGFDEIHSGAITLTILPKLSELVFCYQDNGKGIPEAVLHKIYEPFFTTGREYGGSGLGLHLVYNIVTQLFHGNINCQSEEGQGVTFEITFPFGDALNQLTAVDNTEVASKNFSGNKLLSHSLNKKKA